MHLVRIHFYVVDINPYWYQRLLLKQFLDQTSSPGSEAACPLIHLDFRDEASQTEKEEDPPIIPELKDQEIQTDLCESDPISILEDKSDKSSNVGESQSNTKLNSCPNIYIISSCDESLPDASSTANLDEQLSFDINQLKYCVETDIVDDFVLLWREAIIIMWWKAV